MLASSISIIAKGGFKLGIDFKGGTLLYVKFKSAPSVDELRAALTSQGLLVSTLQPFEDGNELKIDLDLVSDGETLSKGREQIVKVLNSVYSAQPDKLDFNNAGPEALASRLKENPQHTQSLAPDQIEKAAQILIDIRDQAPHRGLIREFADLQGAAGVDPKILTALPENMYLGEFAIRGIEVVGPKIGPGPADPGSESHPSRQASAIARTPTFILAVKLMITAPAKPHRDKTARFKVVSL